MVVVVMVVVVLVVVAVVLMLVVFCPGDGTKGLVNARQVLYR